MADNGSKSNLANFGLFFLLSVISLTSAGVDQALVQVTIENRDHVSKAVETLMQPDSLNIDHDEAGELHSQTTSGQAEKLIYASSGDERLSDQEADLVSMNETFSNIFSTPRSDGYNKRMKETARQAIISKFKEYKLDTFTQYFTATKRSKVYKGVNVVGVLPGLERDSVGKDRILLLGAHYDTVESSPGIDDNGSGMVAVLEVARILSAKPQLNHSVMFVAFDLEELGLLGSTAFVREYLIPKELMAKKSTFLGAYVIDMVLNYDPSLGAQVLPRDMLTGTPETSRKITAEGNRGDFVAIWMRKGHDNGIYSTLADEWRKSRDGSYYKLQAFQPQLPANEPSQAELYRLGTFTRSDHASFWYHKHPSYKQTLNAILLTDMGPWRGLHKKCYHSWCDDANQLSVKNLNYLRHTINVLVRVLEKTPKSVARETETGRPVMPETRTFIGNRGWGRFHWL
ncbi:Aminopeptidase YwaD [Halotydeus destructor]|nr:Aminopeptidase YwaD [Halotydeus destructor]